MLSGRSFCVELITRPEESCRVGVCGLETSKEETMTQNGVEAPKGETKTLHIHVTCTVHV